MSANMPTQIDDLQQVEKTVLEAEIQGFQARVPSRESELDDAEGDSVEESLHWRIDDPEGLMAERPDYWTSLPAPAIPPRESWPKRCWDRIVMFLEGLGLSAPRRATEERVPDEEWTKLYEEEFGPPLKHLASRLEETASQRPDTPASQTPDTAASPNPSDSELMLGPHLRALPKRAGEEPMRD